MFVTIVAFIIEDVKNLNDDVMDDNLKWNLLYFWPNLRRYGEYIGKKTFCSKDDSGISNVIMLIERLELVPHLLIEMINNKHNALKWINTS